MSFFSGLEEGLEKYIEGFFKGRNRGKIHLLDIAKKMVREMRDHRRVSINLVYVPNEYYVSLSSKDWESFEHLTEAFSLELQDYLLQKAEEKGYTLATHPRVIFSVDEKLGSGQMEVVGRFGESGSGINIEKANNSEFEETMNYKPVKDTAPVPVITPKLKYRLEVVSGPLAGKKFTLEDYSLIIGRRESCDIVLLDESISRRHARLEYKKSSWHIHDLNSGNGTFINGSRVSSAALCPGDTVKLGATLCAFKVEL